MKNIASNTRKRESKLYSVVENKFDNNK